MKETNAQVMRWYLSLRLYDFQVTHRPGKAYTNADFFSQVGGDDGEGEPPPDPLLGGRVCDQARLPRTDSLRVNSTLWAEEAIPPQPCWICPCWRLAIRGRQAAQPQLRLLKGEDAGCRLQAAGSLQVTC